MRTSTHLTALALMTFSIACNNGADKDVEDSDVTADTDDTGIAATCVELAAGDATLPADGATDVFYRGQMVIDFAGDAFTGRASFSLANDAGAEVPLVAPAWSDDGTRAVFAPAAALSPGSDYTLTIANGCATEPTVAFTTSDYGAAVSRPADLADDVWEIGLAGADIVEPTGVGGLLGTLVSQIGNTALLIEVDRVDTSGNVLGLFAGVVDKDTDGDLSQDPCDPTVDFGGSDATFDNPYFEINAVSGLTIRVAGADIELDEAVLSGAFSADGSDVGGLRLAGEADARKLATPLGSILDAVEDADDVCTLFSSFGVACAPCADGQEYCFTLDAQNIAAVRVDQAGFDFVPVTEADLAACD